MDENKIFLKIIEDRFERFTNSCIIMSSDFLSLEQQSMLAPFLRKHKDEGVFLYGGYEEAERKKVVFMPDYTNVTSEAELEEYFKNNPEDCPIVILNVTASCGERTKLSHRDFLGALMGEGIKREKIGDIIVDEACAQILVTKEMAGYLEQNYRQVGRVSVTAKIEQIFALNTSEIKTKIEKITVASPRLDNMISSIFGFSRRDAAEAISRGKVFINGAEINKTDFVLKGGEKVVLRGKGKDIYNGVVGTSRKGKIYIEVIKYI